MLLWLMNMGFAGGNGAITPSSSPLDTYRRRGKR